MVSEVHHYVKVSTWTLSQGQWTSYLAGAQQAKIEETPFLNDHFDTFDSIHSCHLILNHPTTPDVANYG